MTQRTQRSQFYFAVGLFDKKIATFDVQYQDPIRLHDPVIRPYKLCKKWLDEVKHHPHTLQERKRFEMSSVFQKTVLEETSKRLGFESRSLTLEDVEAMFVACVFGQAWWPKEASPWCAVLSQDALDALEYREDLKHYFEDGHGHPINGQVACVMVQDAIDSFREATEKATFYFSHSGSILKLLTYLGLFKDSDVNSNNYSEQRSNRAWRTSSFDPFAANVAFALNQCSHNTLSVGLFVNEQLIPIPGCQDEVWCDFDRFQELFPRCDLETVCCGLVDNDTTSLSDNDMF